jgi:deazaflavin-dependent oxidoreductase (nitroreductase family)
MSTNSQAARSNYTPAYHRLITKTHIGLYRRTNGAIGSSIGKIHFLLLMTIGRKSAQERTTPLQYTKDGNDYILIASYGGAPQDPQWFRNLQANPHVRIQVGPQVLDVIARKANPEERSRIWPMVTSRFKNFADYQTKTTREIPVVILTPKEQELAP